ncbi:hypothetical protein Tsubulata_029804 [Turnera subulata]|uniref:DUF7642 domain-containing protein n=1 Tax=Turnera subulata TaxID=218843 RepID=A0A9Q0FBK6_9ROSI|nr:hypothetical protein Tsubulata_029804 [Turnera subulata]
MRSTDEVEEIDCLERGLLPGSRSEEAEVKEEEVLYTASFEETQENFEKYQTARWVLYSLLLVLAWGIGVFMLLYLPVRRYISRRDIQSRKLYLTPNSIVYKVTRPVVFPCFGVLKKEKHVLLASVADVVTEQGYLESFFGVYSLRIENVGVRRPPSDDVQIQGIANPIAFKKAVLARLSNMKSENVSRQVVRTEDLSNLRIGHLSPFAMASPSKSPLAPNLGDVMLLQKLEEVGSTVKRVETLIEEQLSQASEPMLDRVRVSGSML